MHCRLIDDLTWRRFADTAVLGLPRKEIQQCSQRLSHQAKRHPKHRIANDPRRRIVHPFQGKSRRNQG